MKTSKLSSKLNVRDYITMGILLILVFVVYTIIGTPLGMTVIGNLFVHATCSLFWGTIYMLLLTKIPKNGAPIIFGALLSVLLVMIVWLVGIFIFIGAIIAEIIWRKKDKTKFSTKTMCFTVQFTFWYLGLTLPLVFMKDIYLSAIPTYKELYSGFYNLICGPLFFAGLLATIVGTICGSFIGKLLLKKHFEKSEGNNE